MAGTPSEDAESFEAYMRADYGLLVRVAYEILMNQPDAQDAVQDAALKASQQWTKLTARGPARPFMTTAVRNAAIDLARRRGRRRRRELLAAAKIKRSTSPEVSVIEVEDFKQAWQQLSPEQRAFTLMHYDEGLTYKQIAERTYTSLRTVERHMAHAKKILGTWLRGRD